jgi:hypothetical protein
MAHPFYHAQASVRKHGGRPEDYLPLHDWFDESKSHFADPRHRALRHHSEGIFMAERFFGITISNSDGKQIPVRVLGEQHVKEDLGRIPTVADWLRCLRLESWMNGRVTNLDEQGRALASKQRIRKGELADERRNEGRAGGGEGGMGEEMGAGSQGAQGEDAS